MKVAIGPLLVAMILLLAFGTFSVAQERQYSDKAWSFGVIADTQWTMDNVDPEGKNPGKMSKAIADQIYAKFADAKVKLVMKLGDNANYGGWADMDANLLAAQEGLYQFGIGLFPMRGNHETYEYDMNATNTYTIEPLKTDFPQVLGTGPYLFGAENFSSPTMLDGKENSALVGLTYSFDYGKQPIVPGEDKPRYDARFVVLDNHSLHSEWIFIDCDWFGRHPDLCGNGVDDSDWTDFDPWEWTLQEEIYYPGSQQPWITGQLEKSSRGTNHAFVLSHKGLINEDHVDSLFGSHPNSKSSTQKEFYRSLVANDVKYFISAHDHLYNRAIVTNIRKTDADPLYQLTQIISAGASTKFYPAADLSTFVSGSYGDAKVRETQLSQELYNIGYFVYTVDGPRVNVDYYSDATGNFMSDADFPYGDASVPERLYTPVLSFVKKDNFGYSLNGQQFLVGQGQEYNIVQDSFEGTTAKILGGTNNSTAVDGSPLVEKDGVVVSAPRPFAKAVNTGWTLKNSDKLKSNILSLWGMADLSADHTDTYVLSMSFDFREMVHLGNGGIGIATVDSQGNWVNAVSKNIGGAKKFVVGPYKNTYGLGTYGVDPSSKTAWAVINYSADFAVADNIEPVPGKR